MLTISQIPGLQVGSDRLGSPDHPIAYCLLLPLIHPLPPLCSHTPSILNAQTSPYNVDPLGFTQNSLQSWPETTNFLEMEDFRASGSFFPFLLRFSASLIRGEHLLTLFSIYSSQIGSNLTQPLDHSPSGTPPPPGLSRAPTASTFTPKTPPTLYRDLTIPPARISCKTVDTGTHNQPVSLNIGWDAVSCFLVCFFAQFLYFPMGGSPTGSRAVF
jgi:hypothetical protein